MQEVQHADLASGKRQTAGKHGTMPERTLHRKYRTAPGPSIKGRCYGAQRERPKGHANAQDTGQATDATSTANPTPFAFARLGTFDSHTKRGRQRRDGSIRKRQLSLHRQAVVVCSICQASGREACGARGGREALTLEIALLLQPLPRLANTPLPQYRQPGPDAWAVRAQENLVLNTAATAAATSASGTNAADLVRTNKPISGAAGSPLSGWRECWSSKRGACGSGS